MVAADDAVALDEVEQGRHLLEIRRYVRIVAPQMNVVEHDIDDTLDMSAGRVELAGRGSDLGRSTKYRDTERERQRRADGSFQLRHESSPDVGEIDFTCFEMRADAGEATLPNVSRR